MRQNPSCLEIYLCLYCLNRVPARLRPVFVIEQVEQVPLSFRRLFGVPLRQIRVTGIECDLQRVVFIQFLEHEDDLGLLYADPFTPFVELGVANRFYLLPGFGIVLAVRTGLCIGSRVRARSGYTGKSVCRSPELSLELTRSFALLQPLRA